MFWGNVLSDSWLSSPSLQAKQIELQFTIGEAITSAAIGTSSVAARDAWLVTEEEYTPPPGTKYSAYRFFNHSILFISFEAKEKIFTFHFNSFRNIYICLISLVQSRKIVG